MLPLRFIRKAEDHDELLTATEISRELGVYEKKLYAWVAAGAVRAYRSRFTKYTLYSKMEIIRALQLAFAVAEKAA